MTQTLARRSDIRLTLGLYTHVELHDQTAAIESLPGPPGNERETGRVNGQFRLPQEDRCDGEESAA